ncbi:MAG: hypothetical protein AAFU41_15540 [Pseudomonadota bacterium]
MVVDELDALREKFDGCDTLAFADLSTQMILVTNSGSTLRREALDNLCAEAALVLGSKGDPALGQNPTNQAIVLNKRAARIFVRSAAEPSDALCCICGPETDIAGLTAEATACLDRILANDA